MTEPRTLKQVREEEKRRKAKDAKEDYDFERSQKYSKKADYYDRQIKAVEKKRQEDNRKYVISFIGIPLSNKKSKRSKSILDLDF